MHEKCHVRPLPKITQLTHSVYVGIPDFLLTFPIFITFSQFLPCAKPTVYKCITLCLPVKQGHGNTWVAIAKGPTFFNPSSLPSRTLAGVRDPCSHDIITILQHAQPRACDASTTLLPRLYHASTTPLPRLCHSPCHAPATLLPRSCLEFTTCLPRARPPPSASSHAPASNLPVA